MDILLRPVRATRALFAHQQMTWVVMCVGLYLASFAIFYPGAITVTDESGYVQQAAAFAHGRVTVEHVDPLSGAAERRLPSRYAPGTSAVMALPATFFGWRAAFIVPAASVAIAVFATACWLLQARLSPLWSLLVLVYPPTLVMGRVAMSDPPSMAIVALGMWMFWKGIDGAGAYWLVAGFLASVSATFRDTNTLIFMPFAVGCLLRKERKTVWLAAGGIVGFAVWAGANIVVFGRWLNRMNEVSGGLTLSNVIPALGPCALALLVMVPGGLLASLAYRHKRHIEFRVSIVLYVAFYLLWWYSARESGLLKGAILGGRFYMPLVPLIAFAEGSVLQGLAIGRPGWSRCLSPAAVMATALLAVAVHPVMAHFERPQRQLANVIYQHTTDNALVITNTLTTKKYFDDARGSRRTIDYEAVHVQDIRRVLADGVPVQLVFLYRSDSSFWLTRSAAYDRYITALQDQFELTGAGTFQTTTTGRLMIFNVVRAR